MDATASSFDFHGPSSIEGAIRCVPGTAWQFAGVGATCHLYEFSFNNYQHQRLKRAIWRTVWSHQPKPKEIFERQCVPSGPMELRLFQCPYVDQLPYNEFVELSRVSSHDQPQDIGIWNVGNDVTNQLNALIDDRINCQVGWQLRADGCLEGTFLMARLELTWDA